MFRKNEVWTTLTDEQRKQFDIFRAGVNVSKIVRLGLKSINAIEREPLEEWEKEILKKAGIPL